MLLIQGSASALPLAYESVQTCVTSPPYWGLRQYAGEQEVPEWGCALGLEPTPELYVEHMVQIFREVRRVLRKDGTLWLNLGDSYFGTGKGPTHPTGFHAGGNGTSYPVAGVYSHHELKQKDLVGIPWMVAFALRADGWYLRSDIIWHKPNPMPESVTDRPTKAHEYLFLLTKSERYFYDADAIREAVTASTESRREYALNFTQRAYANGGTPQTGGTREPAPAPDMTSRNRRTVWTIATQPWSGAHFATYPEQLVEPCILAGTSPKACGVCGAPWERVMETTGEWRAQHEREQKHDGTVYRPNPGGGVKGPNTARDTRFVGWRSTCEHEDDSGACVVLDPFNGSGTTGRVAVRHGRSYVGVDISREYLSEQALHRVDPLAGAAADFRAGKSEQMVLGL